MDNVDLLLVDWSRGQFALTAMYHWLFVPLTLGLAFMMAFFETIYVKTGNPEWKKITRFWMTLFGINFAIGVATGIILEFEFGTNWSNYSWFVGDIFGAPLAIEGIMAFFMESAFLAIMFFGWNKVSKRFHLISTWLVAVGANLSALWILVANAWMQNPQGTTFNPDTVRNEMSNFWDVALSSTAVDKFLHTITSSYALAAIFVIGVSAWYLLKNRNVVMAKRSIAMASVFGFISIIFTVYTGDTSAQDVAKYQPMKFAAIESLYEGQTEAPLVGMGYLKNNDYHAEKPYELGMDLKFPGMLSILAFRDVNAFVPGIKDLTEGNEEQGILSAEERTRRGKMAIDALAAYKDAKEAGDTEEAEKQKEILEANFEHFGYGYYFGRDKTELIPNVSMSFYSFHIMVILGFAFVAFFLVFIYLSWKNQLQKYKWLLRISIFFIPLAYIASQAGWVVAEVGRQPWLIQDLLPRIAAVSHIDASAVQTTFFLFLAIFTSLLIAEITILTGAIKKADVEIPEESDSETINQ